MEKDNREQEKFTKQEKQREALKKVLKSFT